MLDRIIYFSIHNKLIVSLFTIALIIWGGYSVTRLPIDAVPDITDNQVQIITSSPSLAAQEVERLVTFPVETSMATIPGIKEMRSISRFGLSVITIVFNDRIDVYWARQQVTERLKTASGQLPDGVGTPELAPVTTGLGEIYQYVLHTKPGYEKKYPAMELRSIQDWIVRRQILGTEGVADVSSFGGFLKQYEIAIDPFRLRSFQISISDIFSALAKNNQNTGGAYIDKKPNAYFIRTEGLIENLSDIGQIQVKLTPAGLPVLIRDVATVRFGHAVRYGAMTRNNEGEVVGGLVLMLKGANSSEVIANVKEKIGQIRKTLPEGVVIEPFLDRTKLVNNAISTVSENLLEGALIVIFVLVLLLGNLRAGLIVASVIPLAMLFAVSMMNLFGVSGNLMSLGAIDFGLIVDGAVIIVEATLHHILNKRYPHKLSQSQMDQEVFESASKIRNSAAFGEIIILIVYLPILALIGIEGKMFRPMAQTVSFAILGAFILSLTYVPMISAAFLNKQNIVKSNISDKIIAFFHRIYVPALAFSLRRTSIIIAGSLLLFAISLYLFLNMGGEFIPQLDEGDFAVETRVLTGSSLSETVDAVQKASGVINKKFPDEVIETVGKIGSSEIPTDPMPVEAADMMIILKDKSKWKKARSREELAEKMQATLEEAIPGVTFGFQQPIQMRFNELMTGVKQDVAIKIFGEDLDILAIQAKKIGKLVRAVEGAEDVYVEEISGLPQIVVRFKRDQLSRFGISVEDANRTINTAFAGSTAGIVYEGEKRFDMVVRLNQANRKDMNDVSKLFISTAHGEQIPLDQVASVEMKNGANQIQREDAKRRITVAFNVRGRDVQSIVEELQLKIDKNIKLPAGYYTTYGGQFQNLREANSRLGVAVPAALLLIFILLYFTFNSLRQSLLILTAIPLSAIGGVLALWIRGMPFSISAGIGFIALFGVAVLNGIVLIAEFNFLRKQGITDIRQVILHGTETRLRPVLMTALVASLGFLPMALSTNAGAEVQRPLATVVIGGLFSATLLTLLVLPVLYMLIEKRFKYGYLTKKALLLFIVATGFAAIPSKISAQNKNVISRKISLNEAIREAIEQNPEVKQGIFLVDQQQAERKTAFEMPKTDISWMAGQYNSTRFDNHFALTQSVPNPAEAKRRKDVLAQQVSIAQAKLEITKIDLIRQVKKVYTDLLFNSHQKRLLDEESQRAERFVKAAALRYKTGEANKLEYSVALSEQGDVQVRMINLLGDQSILQKQLQTLINSSTSVEPSADSLTRLAVILPDSTAVTGNAYLYYFQQQVGLQQKITGLQRTSLLPDFSLGYFNQSLTGFQNVNGTETFYGSGKRFQGFQIGLSLPVFNKTAKARIQASEIGVSIARNQLKINHIQLASQLQQAVYSYQKALESLSVFELKTLPLAKEIRNNAMAGYEAGEIGYIEFSNALSKAFNIQMIHLGLLKQFNDSVIEIEFITNN